MISTFPAEEVLRALNPANSVESRTERLQSLLKLVQTSPFFIKDSLKKLHPSLQVLLQDPLVEISLLATNVYTSLISAFSDLDTEFLGSVVANLGDSQPVLRKASHSCLLSYLRTTNNFEPVIKAFIERGFENPEWQIRQKSINSFQSLFLSECQNLKWESQTLRKLVEVLIDRMLDPNGTVAKASEQALLSLNSNENFRLVFTSINKNKQDLLQTFVESYKGKVLTAGTKNSVMGTPVKEISVGSNSPKSFVNIAANLLEKTPENSGNKKIALENTNSMLEKSGGTMGGSSTRPVKSPIQNHTQKIYGIFPLKTVNELLEDKDWQTRSNAIEEIEKIADEIETHSLEFLPHLSDFLKLLIRLLQDNNFKICLTTVNILSKLLVFKEMRNKSNVELMYPRLLEKLKDSKIAIRQASVKIIKEIVEKNLNNTCLESLLSALEDNNQHIREESMNLLSYFIAKTQVDCAYYEKILLTVVKFLEDIKLKVKCAAMDTIMAIAQRMDFDKFENMLRAVLTEEGLALVMANVEGFGRKDGSNSQSSTPQPKLAETLKDSSIKNIDNWSSESKVSQNVTTAISQEKEKRPTVSPGGFELSTSCSSRSIPYNSSSVNTKHENPLKKEEEKRALSAFSFKTSTVSEEVERQCENDTPKNQVTHQQQLMPTEKTVEDEQPKKLRSTNVKYRVSKPPTNSQLKKSSISLRERERETLTPEEKSDGLMIKGKEVQKKLGSFEDAEEEEEKKGRKTKNIFEKSSNFDYKQACYLEKEELEPLKNPEMSFKSLVADIKSDDWSKQFESLNTLRRLILYHVEVLTANANSLHFLTLELLRLIESLRSSVSKNAMLTTTELVEKLKKTLDSEADHLFSRLMKKGLDANAFISEEVKKGLIAISSNCSENKTIPLLLSMTQTKASQAKLNLLICFDAIIRKNTLRFTSLKDHDKLLQSLVSFMFDGNNEVRTSAKTVFLNLHNEIMDKGELEKVLLRVLNDQNYQKVQLILEKEGRNSREVPKKPFNMNFNKLKKSTTPENPRNVKEKDDPPIEINNFIKNTAFTTEKTITMQKTSNKALKNMSNKLKNAAFDQESLNRAISMANNTEWKERLEAVKALTELFEKVPDELQFGKNANSFLDTFLKLLNDSNAKVSLLALQSFKTLIPALRYLIESNLANVLNAIFQVLGSFNSGLRTTGAELLDEIAENQEKVSLVQGLANGSLYAVAKARSSIIGKLIDITDEVCQFKPNVVVKHVCPLALKLAEENKADLKLSVLRLLEKLKDCLGAEFFSSFPSGKSHLILDYMKK